MLLLLHTWKKPTQNTVTTWGEKHQLKRPTLTGWNYIVLEPRKAGKNLILKTLLLRQLSTYFSVLSHLKETGYRLCGRVQTSNGSICLTHVKIEVGWFSSSICTFLTLQNRNRNKKTPTSFQEGQRANLCLPDTARPQHDKSPVSKIHRSWEYLQQRTKTSSSWEECGWKQS